MHLSLQDRLCLFGRFEISLSTFSSARASLFSQMCDELHKYTGFLYSRLKSVLCCTSISGLDIVLDRANQRVHRGSEAESVVETGGSRSDSARQLVEAVTGLGIARGRQAVEAGAKICTF